MILTVSGDLSVTEGNNDVFARGDVKTLFGDVTEVFESADANFVNLECALTESEHRIKKFGPNLKGSPNTAAVMRNVGITHCGLSNNHTYDFGTEGLLDTLRVLEQNGIKYTGIGENAEDSRRDMIVESEGKRIAIIAVCEHEYSYALPDRIGAREYDVYDTHFDIAKAKSENDFVIVIYHGGKEHCRYPSPRLVKACRAMVKSGADAVFCQHSHCIGCYEIFDGGHILYGQGNFHFSGRADKAGDDKWNSGLIVRLNITDRIDLEFIPIVTNGAGIELAKGDERDRILEELELRSRKLESGEWRKEWHDFCETIREYYSTPINPEKADLFSHFLDCEAHSDVLRELFPSWNLTNEK